MPRNWTRAAALAMAGAIMIAVSAGAGDPTASLKQGNPQIKSAGPLGFGPDGILFVGDTQARPSSPSTRATARRPDRNTR